MDQASIELTGGARRPAALRLLSDDRLARRAAEGDRGAFAVIFERHHQGLYRYCRAILRHDEDARDALQTAFARAIAALDGDERTVAIKPWLYRIAHNEAISLLRRRRPHDTLDTHPEPLSASPGPDDRIIASERMRQLLKDLEQLPERQRWALLLRELNDLAYVDIAAALQTTEQAARQSVFEARVMLMELQEGREMPCEDVRRLISERDGRLLRPRRVRAHLKACDGCSGFRTAISERRSDLGVLAPPLPAAAAASVLSALLGAGGGGGWGGGGLIAALGAGKGIVAGAGSKGLATAAALTIAGSAFVATDYDVAPKHRTPRGESAVGGPAAAAAPTGVMLAVPLAGALAGVGAVDDPDSKGAQPESPGTPSSHPAPNAEHVPIGEGQEPAAPAHPAPIEGTDETDQTPHSGGDDGDSNDTLTNESSGAAGEESDAAAATAAAASGPATNPGSNGADTPDSEPDGPGASSEQPGNGNGGQGSPDAGPSDDGDEPRSSQGREAALVAHVAAGRDQAAASVGSSPGNSAHGDDAPDNSRPNDDTPGNSADDTELAARKPAKPGVENNSAGASEASSKAPADARAKGQTPASDAPERSSSPRSQKAPDVKSARAS